MIKITVDSKDGEMAIKATGHANYAEHGKDIVCSAVSTVMQTAVLGLQAISEQYPEHVQIEIEQEGATPYENQAQLLED